MLDDEASFKKHGFETLSEHAVKRIKAQIGRVAYEDSSMSSEESKDIMGEISGSHSQFTKLEKRGMDKTLEKKKVANYDITKMVGNPQY